MKLTPTMDNFTDYLSGSDLRYQLSSSNDLRRCRVESSNVSFDTSIEKKFFIVMKVCMLDGGIELVDGGFISERVNAIV